MYAWPAKRRLCHKLDPTRTASAAVNGNKEKGVSEAFDIIGFNYNKNNPGEIRIAASQEGWDGPVLTPAKLAIAARRVERRTSVPYMRQG
ncbi:MAG: hypothetical protein LAQ69_43860 [Acidobacteriia bacterium]|nr:hypothetical protein [Terriglobia bacterium]